MFDLLSVLAHGQILAGMDAIDIPQVIYIPCQRCNAVGKAKETKIRRRSVRRRVKWSSCIIPMIKAREGGRGKGGGGREEGAKVETKTGERGEHEGLKDRFNA